MATDDYKHFALAIAISPSAMSEKTDITNP
ncbi:Uncharacterised protein [Enterobacter cloacae]|nr:Uncharacterised protein [Enterobacter hormaechei]SAI06019.1 Uncharacterised protein [Enterobacter cloacae]